MEKPAVRFDRESVREAWDRGADAYTERQLTGDDFYRYDFFGPAHVDLSGDVRGLRLLDVGCGSGYFSREMAARGARVTGIDVSPRMIAHAARIEAAAPLGIEYRAIDAADLAAHFAPGSFDVATSCLALQDMPETPRVFRAVAALLPPGARFVISFAHPCSDTPYRRWERTAAGEKKWLCIDRYFDRGPIAFEWIRGPKFTTAAMHAPLEDWFAWILDAGFQIRALKEPTPTREALARRPELADATRVPYFLLIDLVRSARL